MPTARNIEVACDDDELLLETISVIYKIMFATGYEGGSFLIMGCLVGLFKICDEKTSSPVEANNELSMVKLRKSPSAK